MPRACNLSSIFSSNQTGGGDLLRGSGLWLLGFLLGGILTAISCLLVPLRITSLMPPSVQRLKSLPFDDYAAAIRDVCHQASAQRFYDYTPNCTDVREHQEAGEVVYHWNDCRVRSDRPCAPRPAGVTRILAVGDSFTMGSLVGQQAAWPAALERWLRNHAAPPVEVLNRGVSGYDLYQITLLAREARYYDANVVVLALGAENLFADLSPARLRAFDVAAVERAVEGADRDPTRLGLQLTLGKQLRDLVKYSWLSLRLEALLFKSDRLYLDIYQRFNVSDWLDNPLPDRWRRRVGDAERIIRELKERLKVENRQLVLFVIPQRVQVVLASTGLRPGLDPRAFLGPLTTFARTHGIPVIDGLEVFDRYNHPTDLYYPLDGHTTADGNEIIGEAIGEFLLGRHCLPAQCSQSRTRGEVASGEVCTDETDGAVKCRSE